ncbi:hypothetical protein L6164_004128 [Bauhinia variegata]|uniref:Uncharacterized protein n=1 Tax=Bauhinia variegata TaxID=167791 RepID=A0ACB9Q2W1_BAUVA|nr:hypothetical protein L6164_004128 [Bauhinia variegata]
MRARLVVFPIRGKNWCFSRSIVPTVSDSETSSQSPSTFREFWKNISVTEKPITTNAELFMDYIANKMNKAWSGIEKAPQGSFKNKIHGFGVWALSRVKPSEIVLKSISKEITSVEVIYPSNLDARLVRRRVRHFAMRGTIIHRKYLYGSLSLLPLSSVLSVLPLPNIPFFWISFRIYSNWRALQGSEKLFQLVSDNSITSKISSANDKEAEQMDSRNETHNNIWVLLPSEELDHLVHHEDGHDGLSQCAISKICKKYELNINDVIKYKDSI